MSKNSFNDLFLNVKYKMETQNVAFETMYTLYNDRLAAQEDKM